MSKITEESHVFMEVPAADLERVAGILLRVVDRLGLDPHDPYVLTTVTGSPSGFRMARAVHDAAHSPRGDTPATDPADPDHERGGSTVGAVAEGAGGAGVGGAPAPPRRPKRNRPPTT
jgi:hypothetical protein